MPIFRMVIGRLEPIGGPQPLYTSAFFERIIVPDYIADLLPAATRKPHKDWYISGYTKPAKLPHPHKWRGPRLRSTHKRPSMVPRRYRVNFYRTT